MRPTDCATAALGVTLVCVACVLATAAATPTTAAVDSLWRVVDPTVDDSTRLGPLHIYLSSTASVADEAEQRAALAAWLEPVLHASDVEANATSPSPRSHGLQLLEQHWLRHGHTPDVRGCHVALPVVHCVGFTPRLARKAFGGHLRFRRVSKSSPRLTEDRNQTWVLAPHASAPTTLPRAIPQVHTVTGLTAFDYTMAAASSSPVFSSSRDADDVAVAQSAPLGPNATLFPPLSDLPGNAPVFATAQADGIAVLLRCRSGQYGTIAANTSNFSNYCNTTSDRSLPQAPVAVVITLVFVDPGAAPGANFTAQAYEVQLPPSVCVRASTAYSRWNTPETPSDLANAPLCRVSADSPLWPLDDAIAGATFRVSATAVFATQFRGVVTNSTSEPWPYFAGAQLRDGAPDFASGDPERNHLFGNQSAKLLRHQGALDFSPKAVWGQYGVPYTAVSAPDMGQGVAVFVDLAEVKLPRTTRREITHDLNLYDQLAGVATAKRGQLVFTSLGTGTTYPAYTAAMLQLLTAGAPSSLSLLLGVEYGTSAAPFATYQDALAGFATMVRTRFNQPEPGRAVPVSVWALESVGPEWYASAALREHCESELALASNQSITIVAGSGNTGSYIYDRYVEHPTFQHGVSYPAASRSVVAVGASAFVRSASTSGAFGEVAATARWGHSITTGGGSSAAIHASAAQRAATGSAARWVPDLSVVGVAVPVVVRKVPKAVASSTLSAAIFASMLTVVNQMRHSNKEQTAATGLRAPLSNAQTLFYTSMAENRSPFNGISRGDTCSGALGIAAESGAAAELNFPVYNLSNCHHALNSSRVDTVVGQGAPSFPSLQKVAMDWNGHSFGPLAAAHADEVSNVLWLLLVTVCILVAAAAVIVCFTRASKRGRRRWGLAGGGDDADVYADGGNDQSGFDGARPVLMASTYGSL